MAAIVPLPVTISIEDYLNGPIPEFDVEYVDGLLKENALVQSIHSRLQAILSAWFENHAEEWGVVPAPELRTRVSASRVRLPDMVIDVAGPWPETLVDPPLIVIETLSPGDSLIDLSEKLLDYEAMGIPNIWVIDPRHRRGWISKAGDLLAAGRFTVENSAIFLDLKETFARYDRFR